ncbi:hypothetical protein NP493_325g02047 [Ridgeia piscesae]|uniref:Endonuclease/exonuclease/phosphatase domain-containing protein n=1 Tax=Ridgeia piscesae TaxID=27915 RepID=A0AAD9L4R0_RIDPI|nr:hypothetical protein NP493_325g02047 [Ridgeia piscesae]
MPRPVSDRFMTMRLPLSKANFATIISVYAPTLTNPDDNKEAFYNQLASVLSGIPRTDKLLLIGDFNARQVVHNTAKTYLGKPHRKHQDWFDPKDQELQTLMSRRDQANQRVLQTRSTRSTAAYQDACRLLQNRTRALKSDWWERKPVELQRAADRNNMKGFYNGLKESMVTHEEGTCSPEINRWNGDLL